MKSMRKDPGFTLVEVAVVVPIMMVIIIGLFTLLTYLLQSSASEQVGAQNLSEIHSALNAIESDVALSGSFMPDLDDSISDPSQPDGWSYTGSSVTSRVLILRSFATDVNPQSISRRPIFINSQGCGADDLYFNSALTYNTVYFVKDSTLYRRRLLDLSKPICSTGFYQKQSCPSKAAGTAGCMADDEVIATNVSSFSIGYYATSSSDNVLPAYTDSLGPQEVSTADSATITLGLLRKAYGQDLSNTQSLRMSKIITGQSDIQ